MNRQLPDIEVVSAKVHEAWIASKAAQGVFSRKAEDGEELIAPYEALSEKAKELDRGTVRAVYVAIQAADALRITGEASEGFFTCENGHQCDIGYPCPECAKWLD